MQFLTELIQVLKDMTEVFIALSPILIPLIVILLVALKYESV